MTESRSSGLQSAPKDSIRNRWTRFTSWLLVIAGIVATALASAHELLQSNETLAQLEHEAQLSLNEKGELLASTHGRLFTALARDNAVVDMQSAIAKTIEQQPDLVYGVFISHDAKVWAFAESDSIASWDKGHSAERERSLEATAALLRTDVLALQSHEAKRRRFRVFGTDIAEFSQPVYGEDGYAGTLHYGLSLARMNGTLELAAEQARKGLFKTLGLILVLGGVGVYLGAFGAARLSRRLTAPILQLTSAAQELARGEHGVRVRIKTGDEIETLANAFNEMVTELSASYTALEAQAAALKLEVDERRRSKEAAAKLQEQLIQSQKLEAVGQLAGGVAHDFNNILAVVMGQCDVISWAIRDTPGNETLAQDIETIASAAERGANLTRQLLAFARQEATAPRVVCIPALIEELQRLLRRVITETVRLSIDAEEPELKVLIDPARFEQVLVNLVVNARDAMPDGGTITLRTRLRRVTEPLSTNTGQLSPGAYVEVSVSDQGLGMSPETTSRIFEPFFTTKEAGKGTGLGLAMVHGIVLGAKGHILVESQEGKGTNFTILLPRVDGLSIVTRRPTHGLTESRHRQRIVLCEDEQEVRAVTMRILESAGHVVAAASGAEAALALLEEVTGGPTLLITDVVMPTTSGAELARVVAQKYPTLPVLFLSGYPDSVLPMGDIDGELRCLLRKPFRSEELLDLVERLTSLQKAES